MDRRPGRLADPQRLVDRLEEPVALVPHVAEVAAPVLAGHLGQLGDFLLGGVDRRRIDERGGDPDGAGLHRFPHHPSHPVELGGRGLAVDVADHDFPNLGMPDRLDHVHREAGLLELGEELPHRPPAPLGGQFVA